MTFTTLISGDLDLGVTLALSSFLEDGVSCLITFEQLFILEEIFSSDDFFAEDMLSPFHYMRFKLQLSHFIYLIVKFSLNDCFCLM